MYIVLERQDNPRVFAIEHRPNRASLSNHKTARFVWRLSTFLATFFRFLTTLS